MLKLPYRHFLIGLLSCLLTLLSLPTASARQPVNRLLDPNQTIDPNLLPTVPLVYFPETGHHLSNRSRFLDFWRTHGQNVIFGYPLTEEIVENGRVVQYFERARLEHHPELVGTEWEVQSGLLGQELTNLQSLVGVVGQQNQVLEVKSPEILFGKFGAFWHRWGGISIFGNPISTEFEQDGRTVQYFERAKFVFYPEDKNWFYRNLEQQRGITLNTLYEVRLSDLGRQVALARNLNLAPVAKIAAVPDWSPGLWKRRIEVNLAAQRLTAYEDDLAVYHALVATGRDGFETPKGTYAIYLKTEMQDMRGSMQGEEWNVPNVPWVMFVVDGVALHGTYWHNQFGTGFRLSHGCVNLSMDDAQWLYQWAAVGTTVKIY